MKRSILLLSVLSVLLFSGEDDPCCQSIYGIDYRYIPVGISYNHYLFKK